MKPIRKGEKITNNAWGATKATGTARSTKGATVVDKPVRNDTSSKDAAKATYRRKVVGLSQTEVPKNRTPDTSPQPFNRKRK